MSTKRVAQFGGVGGGGSGSPFTPGKSPIGRGGSNTGGYEINVNWDENNTLEKLIGRTRIDLDTSDRNFESRLMPQHKHVEENKNYVLTPEERIKEKFRAQLHAYNEFLKEQAENLEKNSVEYIKKNYQPKEEHISTIEQNLDKRRLLGDKPYVHQYMDNLPELIKPERTHPVLSNTQMERIAIIVMRDKLEPENDPDVEERNPIDAIRLKTPPIGRTPVLDIDLEEYLGKLLQQYTPQSEGLMEMKDNLPDYPDPDVLATNVDPESVSRDPRMKLDVSVGLEGNLHPYKVPKTQLERNNINEDKGIEERYPTVLEGFNTPSVFQ